MNYEELKQKAADIRDETQDAANTAQRVGTVLIEMIEAGEKLQAISDQQEKTIVSILNQQSGVVPAYDGVVESADVQHQGVMQYSGIYYIASQKQFAAKREDQYYDIWSASGLYMSDTYYNISGKAIPCRIYNLSGRLPLGMKGGLQYYDGNTFALVNDNSDLSDAQRTLESAVEQMSGLITDLETETAVLKCIVDLGVVNTSGTAENAAIELAGNKDLAFIRYETANGQIGLIRQIYNNQGSTLQFLTLNGTEFVRTVLYDSGMKSAWRNINKASLVYRMMYNANNRQLEFHDPIQDVGFGGVTLPEASGSQAGMMSAGDKNALSAVVYLGEFASVGAAEEQAVSYASQRDVVWMHYKVEDGRSGMFMQSFSNSSATIQFHYLGGRRYVRQVSWGAGKVSNWMDVTGCERIQTMVWDAATSTVKFRDALGDGDWGGAQIPIPTPQTEGATANAESKAYIFRGETVGANALSTDVLADVNINTSTTEVKIVGKPWGTNNWVERFKITAATSGKSGVMSATQCQSLERIGSFLSKLETALGTTDLDEIVSRIAE